MLEKCYFREVLIRIYCIYFYADKQYTFIDVVYLAVGVTQVT